MKKSLSCIAAISCASWIVLYMSLICILESYGVETVLYFNPWLLFLPAVAGIISGWSYLRACRALDKKKLEAKESELLLNNIAWAQAAMLNDLIRDNPANAAIVYGSHGDKIDLMRQHYDAFIANKGARTRVPSNVVDFIKSTPPVPSEETSLHSTI